MDKWRARGDSLDGEEVVAYQNTDNNKIIEDVRNHKHCFWKLELGVVDCFVCFGIFHVHGSQRKRFLGLFSACRSSVVLQGFLGC